MKRPRSRRPRQPVLGPLGTHSDGKISPDDQGDLNLAVGIVSEKNLVHISFGTQLTWIGLPPDAARSMGEALIRAANQLDAERSLP